MRHKIVQRIFLVSAAIGVILANALSAQQGAVPGQWLHYGGDAGGTKYSPLDQINASNVKQLQVAWRWKTDSLGPPADYNWQATPLMVDGTLYFTAGATRSAVAVDAITGQTRWTYKMDEGERGTRAPRVNNRGLAYWADSAGNGRVILITP